MSDYFLSCRKIHAISPEWFASAPDAIMKDLEEHGVMDLNDTPHDWYRSFVIVTYAALSEVDVDAEDKRDRVWEDTAQWKSLARLFKLGFLPTLLRKLNSLRSERLELADRGVDEWRVDEIEEDFERIYEEFIPFVRLLAAGRMTLHCALAECCFVAPFEGRDGNMAAEVNQYLEDIVLGWNYATKQKYKEMDERDSAIMQAIVQRH